MQDLGESIAELTESQIKKLQLPKTFTDAVLLLKTMDKGPALKRQKAYLGKILRQDEDLIVEIKEKLAEIEAKRKQQNAHFHKLEQWRDRLIGEGDAALHEFMEHYPQADRQQLRQWMRNAVKEQQQGKPPKAAREMFKYLRALEW
ncbi:ribosome biogenesis factor YjgA [Thiomicrorhabdus sediminis]|uniref:ribosome biogenesis factor YjgA n=1 Tax=Thiomicrorhabdus sediminis TaxID=2580412 RepID=UPI001EE7A258|nr:ribosome biogenesis factor YjgA [Thiomicrorhabdus sediminis]